MRTQPPSSNGSGPGVLRYREYYLPDGDVTFRVENFVFKVHRYFFHRESAYFQSMFRTPSIPCKDPPSSETNPVVLEDTTVEAFAGLCWVFYNTKYSVYVAPVEKWVDILDLAQRWSFKEVEQLCIREMQKLPIQPVEKIHIYQKFHIDRSHLAESFAKLTVRQEPLKLEEAQKVGLETMLQISQARELSRGSNSGTKPAPIRLNDSELRSVIQEAFGIVEDPFIDFQEGAGQSQQPAETHPPAIDTGGRKNKK